MKLILILMILALMLAALLGVPMVKELGFWIMSVILIFLVVMSSESLTKKSPARKAPKILIVDDDQVNAMITKKFILRSHPDYEVEHCLNATDGLIYMKRNEVDVLLLDLLMPDIRGDYVIRKLKQDNPMMLEKTIVYTSLSDQADEMKDVISNHVKYLPKPTSDSSVNELVQEVNQLLKMTV